MVENWLISIGVPENYSYELMIIVKFFILLALCVLVNYLAKRYIITILRKIVAKTKNTWDDILLQKNVFNTLSHFAPAIVIYYLAPVWFSATDSVNAGIHRLANTYMIIVACLVLNSLLDALVVIYQRYEVSRKRPIKGYIQAFKILVFFVTGLFVIATLLNKSPWGFMSLLGGLTAVLLLVFKDMILGLVAGIQLSSNNMIARGDWIEMPNYGADGDVIDITLTTVMVQNWDKTITTIPTYALISDSFKNWKGMQESGGRRIKRAVNIDINSIRFVDDELLGKLRKVELLKDYLHDKLQEIDKYNQEHAVDTSLLINGRKITNIGTFRAYLIAYLRRHPLINKEMTFLVRQLRPTECGLPIEVYVFSNDKVWANYEAIQADIFDHIFAVVPEFGLRVFQNPTGSDFQFLKAAA
ncbi:MAG: mechanosensitive ion channel [Candidatus Omnitrophica bacterium]|nr:mechanosensitive ion channel [Candidatus Omnitrophota bacterium]MCB9720362.1 mechanosensitive ion channel [Candidatus Omnitrophota bacterium]